MTDTLPENLPAKNLILIMKETIDVGSSDEAPLPVDYVAVSLRDFFDLKDSSIPTEIHEPGNCHEFLRLCGAFGPLKYEINYFITVSHAWEGGISLNYDGLDNENSLLIKKKLERLYGREISIGSDDLTEFKLCQMRVSNLTYLLNESVQSMRHVFRKSKGIYIIGCNTAGNVEVTEISLTQTFADVVQKPVFGAAYTSQTLVFVGHELFETGPDGVSPPMQRHWDERDVIRKDIHLRQTLTKAEKRNLPLILVPSFWSKDIWKMLGDFEFLNPTPKSDDLISVYEKVLKRSDPMEINP